jgi:peptidoglycan hydrolase CwlO-like protein
MKTLRNKKIFFKNISGKILLVSMSVVVAIAMPGQLVQKVAADQYDEQIAALQQDIARYQAQEAVLNSQAATLQTALDQLSNQELAIQAQIDVSQAKYNQLVIQIADTEKQIKSNQDGLGKTIADMYVNDQITPLEMLASSKSIGDYLDKQEYRSSVRSQLTNTILKIKDLKSQLDKQQSDVKQTLAEQQNAKDALVAKTNEQQNLLNQTQGQESTYQQMIGDSQAQIAEARATQALLNSRFNSNGGYVLIDSGSLGDYPWNASNCPMEGYLSTGGVPGTDGEDGHGYGCRQCASYVAWRIAKETGVYPSWGDAVNFTESAKASPINGVEGAPRAGSIAVMDPGKAGQSHGHVAWVETDPYTNDNGQRVIQVSQYNYDYGAGYGMYSRMELSVNAFDHYVYIPKS